jgi:hypothetical protein
VKRRSAGAFSCSDAISRGRLHPVYVFGGAALIAVKVLNLPISASSWWHAFAGGILALAQ